MTKHEIDEGAFEEAASNFVAIPGSFEHARLRQFLERYLENLPAEPEIEGGVKAVPNSICVHWAANVILRNIPMLGERAAEELTEQVVGAYLDMQRELVAGGRYAPPDGPVVKGRVCE